MELPVGTRVKFAGERRRYTVQASDERFAVCTKPFAARRTVLYTTIYFAERVRGREDLIFGRGFEAREQCQEALERLAARETAVSRRYCVPLEIEAAAGVDPGLLREP